MESNYRTRRGELDLISRHHNTLVIVEVKLRRGTAYGTPLEAVTPRKQQAIRLITEEYLVDTAPCRARRACECRRWSASGQS